MPARWSYITFFIFLFLFPSLAQAEKINVVVSFSILGDMTHEVGADKINLTTLVGPNSDAHVYEPTPADAEALKNASLVIINGLGFEGWLARLIESSGYKGEIVIASQGITPLMLNGQAIDPHAWQNIANGKLYVSNITTALATADPVNAAFYKQRAERYLTALTELDEWVHMQIAQVPERKRRAITSHDAFGYFAKRYGVTFIAPLGVTTGGDASAGDIAQLINQIRKEKIRALFLENMTDPRLMQTLVLDGGAVLGGTLYSDALSDTHGPAATYSAMFKHNVTAMTQAMKVNP